MTNEKNELLKNLWNIHTTDMGIVRIKRNLDLRTDNVVNWCKEKIIRSNDICQQGKNWYVSVDNCVITINNHSYTIITAHKKPAIKK